MVTIDATGLEDLALVIGTAFPVLAVAYYSAARGMLDDKLKEEGPEWNVDMPIPDWARKKVWRFLIQLCGNIRFRDEDMFPFNERFKLSTDRGFMLTLPIGFALTLAYLIFSWRWTLALSIVLLQVTIDILILFGTQVSMIAWRWWLRLISSMLAALFALAALIYVPVPPGSKFAALAGSFLLGGFFAGERFSAPPGHRPAANSDVVLYSRDDEILTEKFRRGEKKAREKGVRSSDSPAVGLTGGPGGKRWTGAVACHGLRHSDYLTEPSTLWYVAAMVGPVVARPSPARMEGHRSLGERQQDERHLASRIAARVTRLS
jgi:hypothetical protein